MIWMSALAFCVPLWLAIAYMVGRAHGIRQGADALRELNDRRAGR